ncbi:uncharacterized protein [Porites lutea]|uniref:uncharacterized protein n=1 Tax=Porites lutea TaxID=51062 RepID=UPI003CC5FCB8
MPRIKRTKTAAENPARSSELIETQAAETSSSRAAGPVEEDDSPGEESRDDDSLIDDGTQPQDPPMFHVALDNQRENQPSTSRNVAPVIIVPYFPLGLAVSPEERMQFNFNLFLYDSLRLPNGLFPDDGAGEVVFEDLQTCRAKKK